MLQVMAGLHENNGLSDNSQCSPKVYKAVCCLVNDITSLCQ